MRLWRAAVWIGQTLYFIDQSGFRPCNVRRNPKKYTRRVAGAMQGPPALTEIQVDQTLFSLMLVDVAVR